MEEKKQVSTPGKRKIRYLFLSLIPAVLLLGIVFILLDSREVVSREYKDAEAAFAYPDLNTGFIPQGIDYDETIDAYFLSGYMGLPAPSSIYVMRRSDGKMIAHALLQKEDGSELRAHCGGVGVWHDYVYAAATNDGVYVFDRTELLQAGEGKTVRALGHFPIEINEIHVTASFLGIHDDQMTIGEFRMPLILDKPKNHRYKTADGVQRNALAITFPLDESKPLGVNGEPLAMYAIPDSAQGILFADNRIVVSCAMGLFQSHVYAFDETKLKECAVLKTAGKNIPVYGLDDSVLTASRVFPPMNEELDIVSGRLVIANESASSRYMIGKEYGMDYCYTFSCQGLLPEPGGE
ncbi:MAG: hypothetical protein IKD66_01915 [Solobacterium sp.]|nr:hypothetical protein [Solobacterium sp.]